MLAALVILLGIHSAHAEPGVTDKSVKLGMSTALSGPLGNNGSMRKLGAEALINEVNRKGGVAGRKIELITYDDGYEPIRTAKNTQKLLDEDHAFALFNYLGSATSKAALGQITKEHVPMFAPASGALFLRDPPIHEVFNLRPSFHTEGDVIIDYLVDTLKITDIGMFYQNDTFGNDGLAAIQKALAKRGMKLVATATYKPNSAEVDAAVETLKKSSAKAVIMWATLAGGPPFIKKARAAGMTMPLIGDTLMMTPAIARDLGSVGENVYLTNTMPFFNQGHYEIVEEYKRAAKEAGIANPENFFALEGYFTAKVMVEALRRAGKDLTRDHLIDTLEKMDQANIGGLKVSFSTKSRQGMDKIFLGKIHDGKMLGL